MDKDLTKRAKEIIEKIKYITIATASKDAVPWNTPVYAAFDKDYNFYWDSWIKNIHSENIAQNNKVFLVIYDSTNPVGKAEGVYIQAKAQMLSKEEEIKEAQEYISKRKGQDPAKVNVKEFLGKYPRRTYKAIPLKVWMKGKDYIDGNYIDTRIEIKLP